MRNDFTGKAVLITGGTKGIGLATGLAFARHGAHLYLTHRWSSADEDEVGASSRRWARPSRPSWRPTARWTRRPRRCSSS